MSEASFEIDRLVHDLQDNLGLITPEAVKPLPQFEERIKHNGKYIRPKMDLEPGLYLADDALDSARAPVAFSFQAQHGSRIGREDSHNKVFFGKLWSVMAEGPEEHVQVALKPLPQQRRESLVGEMAAFQYLGSLALPTFEPTGLLVTETEYNYLLTRFDGPVATMDTVEWESTPLDEMWHELTPAVDTLFMLHRNALFHCDLYFRNIAFNERGETVVVDPELMVSAKDAFETLKGFDMGNLTDEQEAALRLVSQLMRVDFTDVEKSIEATILPLLPKRERPRNGEARFKLYKRYLYEPYKAEINALEDESTKQVLRLAFDLMMVVKKELARRDTI